MALEGFSPLTGIRVIRPSGEWLRTHFDEYGFSPLTGIRVIRLRTLCDTNFLFRMFQSPYGDSGNTTLSPSTRSLTGLTGDFFKPPGGYRF